MVFENPTFKPETETKRPEPDGEASNIPVDSIEVQDRLAIDNPIYNVSPTTKPVKKRKKSVTFDMEVEVMRASVSVIDANGVVQEDSGGNDSLNRVVLVHFDEELMKVK